MDFVFVFMIAFRIYCTSKRHATESEPTCSKRARKEYQSNDNFTHQIAVKSFNTALTQQILQNAFDFYTDILKCSLFCYK